MRIAGIGAAVLAVAAAIALIGWHHLSESPTPASRATVVPVDGIVGHRFTAVLYQGVIPLSQEPHTSVRIRVGQTARPLRVHIIEPVQ